MAQEKEKVAKIEEKEEILQFLTFTLGEERYGVNILAVTEIRGWTKTTNLPNSLEYMRGVINLRGSVIPIIDLRARFNMGLTDADEKNVVIILTIGDIMVGVLVDAVSDIIDARNSEIKDSPSVETNIDANFLSGLISVDDKMVILLDIDRLFCRDAMKEIEKVAKES